MSAFYRRHGGPCAVCRVARDYHRPFADAGHPFLSESEVIAQAYAPGIDRAGIVTEYTRRDGGGMFAVRRAHQPATIEWIKLTSGYAVAVIPNDSTRQAVIPAPGDRESLYPDLDRLARRVAVDFPTAEYVGTWIEGCLAYVDPIIVIQDRAEAIRAGQAYGQLGIYDLAADRVIYIDGRP